MENVAIREMNPHQQWRYTRLQREEQARQDPASEQRRLYACPQKAIIFPLRY